MIRVLVRITYPSSAFSNKQQAEAASCLRHHGHRRWCVVPCQQNFVATSRLCSAVTEDLQETR